ncbi:MAG: class I SAM-dependent methyltransferase [Propionibacteriaceae bacterium]|jgi:SAM-dependent methyltransferase|nr:class I SAM-dependent methyltransferase [Propionibacteriaceae bacterium]
MASAFPPEALAWLVGEQPSTVLCVGTSPQVATLAWSGHSVTIADTDPKVLTHLATTIPNAHVVAARPESLPFDPCVFNSVLSIQNFHTLPTGLALSEWARVLVPGGHIAVSLLTRDDSVPWVRRLRTTVQRWLPEAMKGDYGVESTKALTASPYFHDIETTKYRLWVPSTREYLQNSARTAPGADELSNQDREMMVAEVGKLYDTYARVPDPLQLPYQLSCWKAYVDQAELTQALLRGDVGLTISL